MCTNISGKSCKIKEEIWWATGFHIKDGYVDQIFTLKQLGEKLREKKWRVYVDSVNLEKVHDKIKREGLRQVLRMRDLGDINY